VALAWIPRTDGTKVWACHKNDIVDDNHYKNLYWGSPQDNSNDMVLNHEKHLTEYDKTRRIGKSAAIDYDFSVGAIDDFLESFG